MGEWTGWDQFLLIFDICSTILVTVVLLCTSLIAIIVYFKLIFYPLYCKNYPIKLIVLNGIAELLSCLTHLIVYQLTSYPFMLQFYLAMIKHNLVNVGAGLYAFFVGISRHSSLFIALNRLKAITSLAHKEDFKRFFFVSLILSLILSLTGTINIFVFNRLHLVEMNFGFGDIVIPRTISTGNTLSIIGNVQTAIVSSATVLANFILAIFIIRRRKLINTFHSRWNQVEQGLMLSSIVSYLFCTLYQINSVSFFASIVHLPLGAVVLENPYLHYLLASYLSIEFCATAQFLFLGLASIIPFWSLIMFAPTIRRSVLTINNEASSTIVSIRN